MKALQPHTGTPGKAAVDSVPRGRQGARCEHPTSRHSPHTLLPAWLCSARTFPHPPLRFPVECRKGLCSSWGVTVNGTTCSLRGNSSAGQGHGDTWEQGLGHLLPVGCQEAQAQALWQSPGLAVVVSAQCGKRQLLGLEEEQGCISMSPEPLSSTTAPHLEPLHSR